MEAVHPVLIVMGVSAAGKSTIARAVAARVDGYYVDADDLHPTENVRAMAAGRPLDDSMRAPWLEAVAAACAEARRRAPVVLACSALRRRYRDMLRDRLGEVVLIHATASREALERRISHRQGHYMPPALLQSQLDTLEPPDLDEQAIHVDAEQDLAEVVEEVVRRLEPRR
ncbi:gluconokinase [Roseitranquillus sediminis]|uniref:gluconokinase n=1 Tax=Roseitranquillus sediminis TaxID=2809051 RepID=UPI001D0CB9C0|nr:gluconokinase [Roseitranquillus sediminis]MBM9595870.1 gluconokinase [Roseitranquillus sediminis]